MIKSKPKLGRGKHINGVGESSSGVASISNPDNNRSVRVQVYVDPVIFSKLNFLAKSSNTSISMITNEVLGQALVNDYNINEAILTAINKSHKASKDLLVQQSVFLEIFMAFMRVYYAHTPSIPEENIKAAKIHAQAQYTRFLGNVSKTLSRNPNTFAKFLAAVQGASIDDGVVD